MKVVITIEDKLNGHVKMTSEPTFERISQMLNSGHTQLTPAVHYAARCARACMDMAKENQAISVKTELVGG